MIGPVFWLELVRAARRAWLARLSLGYSLLVALQYGIWLLLTLSIASRTPKGAVLGEVIGPALTLALHVLAWQQFGVVLLAVPAFVAGSITDEKTAGTMDHLLTAPLSDRDIVVGKWAAACVRLLSLVLPAVPLSAAAAGVLGLGPGAALTLSLGPMLPLPALAAAALAVSALSSRTATAVGVCYSLFLTAAGGAFLTGDPFGLLPGSLMGGSLGWAALYWLVPVVPLLGAATLMMRPMYLRQSGKGGTRTRGIGLPPLAGSPVRWKERVLGGRWLPPWLGAGGVAGATLALHALALWTLGGNAWVGVVALAVLFAVASGVMVAVRAAVSVSGEREQKTWETLLLIPPTTEQILRAKLWGVMDGLSPYQWAYLIAAAPAALVAGPGAAAAVAGVWCAGWLGMYFTAAAGVECSVRGGGSWQALVQALFESARTVFERGILMAPIAGVIGGLVGFPVLALGMPISVPVVLGLLGGVGALALLLLAHAEERIERACHWVAQHERVPQGGERFVKPV